MNYDHKKKFGLLKFHSGYGKFYLNSPMGYCRKIINAQTVWRLSVSHIMSAQYLEKFMSDSHGTW